MVKFERVTVDDLPDIAVHYLDRAIKRTPASTSQLDATLHMARKYGDLYLVIDDEIIGAIYTLIYDTKEGKVLSPVLVGGKQLSKWRQDLFDFLLTELIRVDGIACRFIGRDGWGKKFPICRTIGSIYEFKNPGVG